METLSLCRLEKYHHCLMDLVMTTGKLDPQHYLMEHEDFHNPELGNPLRMRDFSQTFVRNPSPAL
jgi:hypothetical protein